MKILKYFLIGLLILGLFACKTKQTTIQDSRETEVSVDLPKSVNIRGEKIHYIERGEGEPLIFIHGTIGDYRAWSSRMESYSNNYHVVAYSRRYAYPNKQEFDSLVDYSVRIHADDLYAFIKELNLEKAHIVGHSYGAFTALTMALEHPEVVQSLVLGEPPASSLLDNISGGQALHMSFLENHIEPAARAFRANKNEEGLERFAQGVFGMDFRLSQIPPEAKQAWMDNLLELWGSTLKESFLALDNLEIKKLEVPVLLLVGDRSPQWLVEVSKELDFLLPNSRLVTLENSSHGLYFQNPKDADQAVFSFIGKH